ncbi:hypothetical protein TNIN_75441 [Trichonephila inaurata madagascariensis]|uniref:Uncharacterized protein n=1 Tax=Trichonephila inaurata madagascariensis TaxID=2747483 RepID=A0A8X7BTS7_9ARAC|nr:hypothetical protein TNIN_75441 [Trichonephila inaurata madagascariensis]
MTDPGKEGKEVERRQENIAAGRSQQPDHSTPRLGKGRGDRRLYRTERQHRRKFNFRRMKLIRGFLLYHLLRTERGWWNENV